MPVLVQATFAICSWHHFLNENRWIVSEFETCVCLDDLVEVRRIFNGDIYFLNHGILRMIVPAQSISNGRFQQHYQFEVRGFVVDASDHLLL